MAFKIILCLLVATTANCVFGVNLQAWSHQAEEGKKFVIDCTPTDYDREPNVTEADTFEWYKRGNPVKIASSDHHKLQDNDKELAFKPVKSESTGIYYCKVYKGGDHLGTVIKGLNIGGYFSGDIEEYETNIITGAIAGGAVLFLICFVTFVSNYRYLTTEQKEKRRERKEEMLAKQRRLHDVGVQNFGLETNENEPNKYEINGDNKEINTHF